jgi:BirA family biotin operon repressor/biotin-[acetyl-CoA-carboxylase] ligase
MLIGVKQHYFDAIDSTNEYAKSIINHSPEGTVVRADEQKAGKGRFGRTWYSPPEGIWMSVILKPKVASLMSVTAGVSVCAALHSCDILTGIKWPNDILLNSKKVAGILTEVVDDSVVVGIGVNLNIRKFPAELKDNATSIFLETKKHLEANLVYNMICRALDESYQILQKGDIEEILVAWRHYSVLLGQAVFIQQGDEEYSGRVLDIDRTGALVIMQSNREIRRVIAGLCHLRRDST